jgi:hypothetical protein
MADSLQDLMGQDLMGQDLRGETRMGLRPDRGARGWE